MGRTFFTGGTMPSHSLLLHFQVPDHAPFSCPLLLMFASYYIDNKDDLRIEHTWGLSGEQYARQHMFLLIYLILILFLLLLLLLFLLLLLPFMIPG